MNRYKSLKENWLKIFTPIVEHLKLQMRFNFHTKCVEIRTPPGLNIDSDKCNIQKAADFIQAFILGFEIEDAVALIRLDELFIESFEIQDGMFVVVCCCFFNPELIQFELFFI